MLARHNIHFFYPLLLLQSHDIVLRHGLPYGPNVLKRPYSGVLLIFMFGCAAPIVGYMIVM